MKTNFPVQLFYLFLPALAVASSGTGIYTLPWPNPSEVLEYHSCGMADACWVAELKDTAHGDVKIRLRCDGEKLYLPLGSPKVEKLYRDSCAAFEGAEINSKSTAITQTMKALSGK